MDSSPSTNQHFYNYKQSSIIQQSYQLTSNPLVKSNRQLLMLRSLKSKSKSFFLTENRIEIVFFVHPVKRFVHWSIGSLIDAVALQQIDHTLQGGRSSVF